MSKYLKKMTKAQSDKIIKEIKQINKKLTEYSEKARLDAFLGCYANTPVFLHISSDGNMRNYEEFRKICRDYYHSLQQQKISAIIEKFNVINSNLVVFGWTGNIIARFKNGDMMNMNNYSITNVFKKIDSEWKIIHSHESALPPVVMKKR